MSDPKIRLGGLWRQRSKSGVEYLTGKLGMARLLIFLNNQKSNQNSPDFTMFLAPDDRAQEGGRIDQKAEPPY